MKRNVLKLLLQPVAAEEANLTPNQLQKLHALTFELLL